MLKLFNGLNGIFYLIWGAWGMLKPVDSAILMGWDANTLLGLHEMRATWASFMMLGVAILFIVFRHESQRGVTFALVMGTMGLLIGRTVGLLIDGIGPQRSFAELGIEIVVVLFGFYLLRRSRTS